MSIHAINLESAVTIEQWIKDEATVFSDDTNSVLSGKLNNIISYL